MNPDPDAPYRGKRLVDLALLAAVALPAAAVAAGAAVAVRLGSPGPVLFRQERTGMGGAAFTCLKFRTMAHGDNPLVPDERSVTPVGRWLRRFSIDELPQLMNVARGEMSIVGPRPMLPFQAARCDAEQSRRFRVRPGLTGWAQVNGRNRLGWPARIALDVDYVARQSPALDLRIVAATLGALLSGDGVEGHDPADPFVTGDVPPDTPPAREDAGV